MTTRIHSAHIGLIASVVLVGSFAADARGAWAQWLEVIDLTHAQYGGNSVDVGRSALISQAKLYTAGMSYGQYALARIDGTSGQLDPGTPAAWGTGIQGDPVTPPVGWVAVQPGSGSNQAATDIDLAGGTLFVTGPANAGESAGFAAIAKSDGSLVGSVKTMRPKDIHYAWFDGASPGGGIRIVGGYAYVFGQTTISTSSDILWVAKRELNGDPTFDFGEPCPNLNPTPSCPANGKTGYSILEVGYQSAQYRDTATLEKVVYALASVSDTTESRILVATIDLTIPSTAALDVAFEDGGAASQLRPFAIAVQSDGKVLVAGSGDTAPNTKMFVIRYNADGTRDTTFSGNGRLNINPTSSFDQINDIAILPNGKIFAVGGAGNDAISLRINSDGTLDTTYSATGYIIHAIPSHSSVFGAVASRARVRATGSAYDLTGSDLLVADLAASDE